MNISNLSTSTQIEKESTQPELECVCSQLDAKHILQIVDILKKYLGSPLLLFGIIFNVLALLTLQEPRLKESPYIHLMGLAAANLAALLLIFINLHACYEDRPWQIFLCYIYYPLTNTAASFSVWIMVMMTLERCIFMQFPLWAPIWCTNSSAKLKLLLVLVAAISVNTPRFFWYEVVPANSSDYQNGTKIISLGKTHTVITNLSSRPIADVLTWMYSVILNFLPNVILLVTNSFIIFKIRIQQKRRRNTLRVHKPVMKMWTQKQTRLTITLVAITGIFTLLVLPSAFVHDGIALLIFGQMTFKLVLFKHASNFLIWINLSFNFLMYTFINMKFKRAFKRMLSQWRTRIRHCGGIWRVAKTDVQQSSARINACGWNDLPLCRQGCQMKVTRKGQTETEIMAKLSQ